MEYINKKFNDELVKLAYAWLCLSKKDKQYAVQLLLDRNLAEVNRNLEIVPVKGSVFALEG